jgi:hypothetical protein
MDLRVGVLHVHCSSWVTRVMLIAGRNRDEVLGLPVAKLHSRENDASVIAALWQAIKEGRGHKSDIGLLMADSETLWTNLSVSCIGYGSHVKKITTMW